MTDQRPSSSDTTRPQKRRTIFDRTRDAIQDAVDRGVFDNLPNKGQPLDFSFEENPYIPADSRQAWRMLRDAGFGLPWMEDRKLIDRYRASLARDVELHNKSVQAAVQNLARMPAYLRPSREERLKKQHETFLAQFTRSLDALNARIDIYNLTVPVVSLQVTRLNRQQLLDPIEALLSDQSQR